MSDKSPLFVSSLELLAHATEIYTQNNPKKYKFVILHLANAIELILKDRLIDEGVSIYKGGTSETVSVWKAFSLLEDKDIKIKERPIIELLIDDRNTIQHRFGFPNVETVYYYLENVVSFFKRFMEDEYGVELSEALGQHLDKKDLLFLGLVENEFTDLDKLFEISQDSAILKAYGIIEKEFKEIIKPYDTLGVIRERQLVRHPYFFKLLEMIEKDQLLATGVRNGFAKLHTARNISAHGVTADSQNTSFEESLETAKLIISALKKVRENGYLDNQKYNEVVKEK